jgi:TonB-dependent SusC/RagA subfamily outer membrane receptor
MALFFSASALAADLNNCCPATGPEGEARSTMTQEMQPIQRVQRGDLPSYFNRPDAIILASEVAVPAISIAEMITGRVAGVFVSGNYLDYRIRIRGAQGPPLVVLDQMPFRGYDDEQVNDLLLTIPAADVESIEIFKSLSQAAIYGPGAANGVIKINTRQ